MRVLFFGHLTTLTHCTALELPVDGVTAAELWTLLLDRFPSLAVARPQTRLACNCEFAPPGARFTTHDEIALIPPVSGG